MVEFFENETTMGTFGSVDDSQSVQAFRQIEDAGEFYEFLDKIFADLAPKRVPWYGYGTRSPSCRNTQHDNAVFQFKSSTVIIVI